MPEFGGHHPDHIESPERTERIITSLAGTVYHIIREELFVELSPDVRHNNRRLPYLEHILDNYLSGEHIQKYLTEAEIEAPAENVLEKTQVIKRKIIENIKELLTASLPDAKSQQEREFIRRCVKTISKKYDQKNLE